MSFDIKGIFNIDGRNAKKELKKIVEETEKASSQMSSYLQNAFSGDLGTKIFKDVFKKVGLGPVADLVKDLSDKFQERIKSIRIGSLRTGLDVETFQRVQNVTEAQGSSAETAAKAMEHIAIAQEKIKQGVPEGEKLLESFNALGISLTDIDQKNFQQIFFKIAEGMQGAELSGARLAAIHELLGKTGAELIPSFQKGFNSVTAGAGLISEDEVKQAEKMNKALAEGTAAWKDMATSAQKLSAEIVNAAKGIPILLNAVASGSLFKRFTSTGRAEFEKELAEKREDEARMAEQLEKINARSAEKSKKQLKDRQDFVEFGKEEKKAGEKTEGLEDQLQERLRANTLERLSPSERKESLKQEIEDQKSLIKLQGENDDGSKQFQNERLRQALVLANLQHDLFGLEKPKSGDQDQVRDSLSRIGGGFASDGAKTLDLLENIRKNTEDAADFLKNNGDGRNPMSGF